MMSEEGKTAFNVLLFIVVVSFAFKVFLFGVIREKRESEVFANRYCTDYLKGEYNLYENNSLYYGHYCYVNNTVYEMVIIDKGFNLTEADLNWTCGWRVTCA